VDQYGQYPDPGHTIAHLSDPHLLAGGALQYGHVDTEARLTAALERLGRLDPPPEALVFTGDLADKAEPKAYLRLRELVEPAAEAIGAQVIWVMGNHDERAAYSRHLFDVEDDGPQDRVYDVRGLRIISLDTSVPGWHHGELRESQLAWLAAELATPAPHGTVLAMHHPPIPVPMMRIAEIIELLDHQPLADVLTGSDVRAILGGHFHFTSSSTFAGIPVSVASATCYTSELAPNDRLLSGVDGHQSFNMVHVYADRVVHSVVPATDSTEVTGYGLDMAEPFAALSV
jgi:3',5'-cyclic-AMP phosphodiesterase